MDRKRVLSCILSIVLLLPGLALGVAGILWSASMWIDWRLTDRIQLAAAAVLERRLPSGERSFETIAEGRIGLERFACAAEMRRAVAILQLNKIEHAGGTDARKMVPGVTSDLRDSLLCTPTDGFVWFALGWMAQQAGWSKAFAANCFTKSYETAPWEGWIALRRNPLLIAELDRLPEPLAERVLREFETIVSNGYYQEAYSILTGPGWVERDRLIASLATADPIKRYNFSEMLNRHKLGLQVPGVPAKDSRPWNT